ncbi:hypothetical protein QBC46DRAFT_427728 [Diplogelasinospora grovesii]|uniref:GPI inositol-deacylase n=1 Tax=Diplogelasinospora grovesii TaxID=303347 RepID=A0AAN6MW02_9PEZI|nr:hypothetical protein QBC46DRAFT_427728 [Diplogelasinospora grovesii]
MFRHFRHGKAPPKDATIRRISDSSVPSQDSTFDIVRGRPTEYLLASSSAPSTVPRSRGCSPEPAGLGLRVLHQPEFASLDIIFVHGLGGHSQKTWSKNHDAALFWPETWLPFDPDVGKARILTFGYNANWRAGSKSTTNITDFAKELLYEMRFAKDVSGEDLAIGANPIIFVVHSMGGLVVKKAYLLGLHDDTYKGIISSVAAIVFLSTPHRGTNLAAILNRVLAASFQSPKNFISELNKSSTAIEELNEQFRHIAPRLSIWSFYETMATSIGPKKIMVLEKDSSVLGYPTEISRPLQADHHDVCKYSSPVDSNYLSVRNAIKSLVSTFRSKVVREEDSSRAENSADMQELFRNCHTSEEDYSRLRRDWIPGRLKDLGLKCQYFLFNYSDQHKRSVAGSFRALAFQLAKELPAFRRMLSGSSPASLGLESADPSLIWRNTFEKVLFGTGRTDPLYWVFDALDESDSPKSLLECLRSLSSAEVPLRILILSRNTNAISVSFDRLSHAAVHVARIEKTGPLHNRHDIELLLEREIRHMGGSNRFKQQLMQNIMSRSEGNFLWTKLVLEEILGRHTEESIQEVLEEVPDDMTDLYRRMEQSLVSSTRKSNKPLIRTLLEWTICAQRLLSLQELSQALQPDFPGLFDLRRTIQDACGQFVYVNHSSKVTILHHTAREYFTSTLDSQFHIDVHETHRKLFVRALSVLGEPDLRWRLLQCQHALQASEPFVFYAVVNWPYHLAHSHAASSGSLDHLVRFFRGPAVLVWVHTLAIVRRLEVLVRASKALSSLVRRMRKSDKPRNPLLHRLSDLALLEDWIIDLVKLVGKFGPTLVIEPGLIYDIIPAFCPAKSAMYRQHYDLDSAGIKILGAGDDVGWSDNLGRLVLPGAAQAWELACTGNHLAVLASTGVVHIWDSSNFTEIGTISHGEPVTAMALNDNGSKLATYGLKSCKTWSVSGGKLLSSTVNPPNTKAMAITFAENDQKLLVGGDDNVIRHIWCHDFDRGWQILNQSLLKKTGAIVNSPMCLAFTADSTYVGVSYRGAPLSIWRLSDGRCVNRCKRAKNFRSDQRRSSANWFAVDRFT